jgi:hypothetical protein
MAHFSAEIEQEAKDWRDAILRYANKDTVSFTEPYADEPESPGIDSPGETSPGRRGSVGEIPKDVALVMTRLKKAAENQKFWKFWSCRSDVKVQVFGHSP